MSVKKDGFYNLLRTGTQKIQGGSMKGFDTNQTISALPAKHLIENIQKFFVEGCVVPLQHNHAIQDKNGEEVGKLLLMPAWQPSKYLGLKTVGIFPNNNQQGLAGLHSVYILYDASTGVPIATLDGNVITSRRTAAASALAAKYLSRADSSHLLWWVQGKLAVSFPRCTKQYAQLQR